MRCERLKPSRRRKSKPFRLAPILYLRREPLTIRATINETGLHFDRDYGADRRTGWTALRSGRVLLPQLAPLRKVLWALTKQVREDRS